MISTDADADAESEHPVVAQAKPPARQLVGMVVRRNHQRGTIVETTAGGRYIVERGDGLSKGATWDQLREKGCVFFDEEPQEVFQILPRAARVALAADAQLADKEQCLPAVGNSGEAAQDTTP